MEQVKWNKCTDEYWCKLESVNLKDKHFDNRHGVYVIWYGRNPVTVYVGHGYIKDRISAHRTDSSVLKYADLGLYVTWAFIAGESCAGVEKFIATKLKPKEGDAFRKADSVEVNLPW